MARGAVGEPRLRRTVAALDSVDWGSSLDGQPLLETLDCELLVVAATSASAGWRAVGSSSA